MSVLVLITGTGRSGTSTMSGTFHHLGLHVPGPYLGANDSNPKGFFESKWAVSFHKEITKAAGINDFDGRPGAFDRAQAAITPDLRRRLVEFLTEQARESDQVVVKDPRSVWGQSLWREAAAEAGLEIRYVSMLRHPAEVLGSRATYYAKQDDAEQRRRYEIFNLARWINNSVISERETRGQQRAFVRYTDLLTDWRPVLIGLGEQFGLTYDVDLAAGTPTPVDEFIDPDLRRHQVTWEELELPVELQDVAQQTWDALDILADKRGEDAHASSELDVQGARYRRIFQEASAISHDAMEEAKAVARRAGAKAAREKMAEREARAASTPAAIADRPVGEVGARDLLTVVGKRLASRVRPSR
ncbi:sulfotransferase family protein [Nocardioides sp.]|uniref:sulfotransferase family protein n=1 Tax=Nocardioides sp. TaxID=35761 RepID=UPI003561F5B8